MFNSKKKRFLSIKKNLNLYNRQKFLKTKNFDAREESF